MRYQDQVVRCTQRALDDICRAVLALPSDRVEWAPHGKARSALDQMREVALSGSWFQPIIENRRAPAFDGHAAREAARLRRANRTLDECIETARRGTSSLCTAIVSFPDGELETEIFLPFAGGITMTMADVLLLHYQNMVYHNGQINYIQLMLGDADMH